MGQHGEIVALVGGPGLNFQKLDGFVDKRSGNAALIL
jgi:hypothetical protein